MNSHQSFDVETLERKLLLAGNVSVDITNAGDLLIRGDAESNEIRIVATESSRAFRVIGVDTTVENQESFVAEGVTGGMRILMRGGDDVVVIRPADRPIEPSFIEEEIVPFQLSDRLFIQTGAGEDVVDISGFDDFFPDLGPTESSLPPNTMQLDDIDIKTKYGDDQVYINNVLVNGNIDVRTKTGSDFVDLSALSMGEGECEIIIRACSGSDEICMYDIGGEGVIMVGGGGGRDTMYGAEFLPDSVVYKSIEEFEFKFEEE